MIKKHSICFLLLILLSGFNFGQSVVNLVPWNGTSSTETVAQIVADTTANGFLADRVYQLTGGGIYIWQQTFNVPDTKTLRLTVSGDQKAIIYLYPTGTGATPGIPPGNPIRLRGGDLVMSGIAMTGYFEPIDTNFNNVQGTMIRTDNEGSNVFLDNCVFSNINGQILRTEASVGTIRVTNCLFTNLGALSTSNFGAGKGIDLRAVSCDSLILVNNTWTNYQDRVIRHYNFSNPLQGTGNIEYVLIDHNTMYNGMGFHGLLSLGNVGSTVIITNNLLKDAFAAGEDSTDATRTAEWANTGEVYPNGLNRMVWIFTAPNQTTNWTVKNNYYAISNSGQSFFNEHTAEPITEGSPLSWHINSRLGADSVNAFVKIPDPGLINTQNLMLNLMRWYVNPAGGNKTKNTPSTLWNRATDDMDRKPIAFWLNELNAAYSTSSVAYSGAEGYPAGDLNWFPDKKAEWEAGVVPFSIAVDGNKDDFFAALTKPDDGYLQLRAYAGNDNGIPKDDADLSAKVWGAWTDSWLYLYCEVKDDTIAANATNVWEEDGLELKFDPQPTDSTNTGSSIFATGFTALAAGGTGVSKADDMGNIAAADKKFNRSLTTDGYKLELGIKWTAVKANNETITPAVGNVFGLAINFHDNDGHAKRQASVMWAAVMKDHVWDTPKYLGTAKLLADNKIQFIPTNNMTGVTSPVPFDGSDWTGVKQVSEIPQEFALSQNYPNPFNPTTLINFSLKESGVVSLKIYNSLGELVTTLVENEVKDAGMYTANFDASNLSTGIYVYVLRQGQQTLSKKMLLMK